MKQTKILSKLIAKLFIESKPFKLYLPIYKMNQKNNQTNKENTMTIHEKTYTQNSNKKKRIKVETIKLKFI